MYIRTLSKPEWLWYKNNNIHSLLMYVYVFRVQALKNDYGTYKPLIWRTESQTITSSVSWSHTHILFDYQPCTCTCTRTCTCMYCTWLSINQSAFYILSLSSPDLQVETLCLELCCFVCVIRPSQLSCLGSSVGRASA